MSTPESKSSDFGSIALMVIISFLPLTAYHFLCQYQPKPRVNRSNNSCIANLKQIDGAASQWALENKKTSTDTYLLSGDVLDYLKGSVLPSCPAGGFYSPGKTISDPPRCSVPGHSL
jgi:hypothetical protein